MRIRIRNRNASKNAKTLCFRTCCTLPTPQSIYKMIGVSMTSIAIVNKMPALLPSVKYWTSYYAFTPVLNGLNEVQILLRREGAVASYAIRIYYHCVVSISSE
jgi:hypothetical protein